MAGVAAELAARGLIGCVAGNDTPYEGRRESRQDSVIDRGPADGMLRGDTGARHVQALLHPLLRYRKKRKKEERKKKN